MSVKDAFNKFFKEILSYDGFAGAIGVTKNGDIYFQESHPNIVFAAFNGIENIIFN